MSEPAPARSERLPCRGQDARTRIEVRREGGSVWLTQAQRAEPYQTTPQNITQHLKAIYGEGELDEAATCKPCLHVRQEGGRRVSRRPKHDNLEAILAVGYRVRSPRGTQFRQWATKRLREAGQRVGVFAAWPTPWPDRPLAAARGFAGRRPLRYPDPNTPATLSPVSTGDAHNWRVFIA